MNNFCRGSEYTETKINLKRLHRCWREGDNSGKTKNESSPPNKLADPEHRRCVLKTGKQLEVNEEIPTGQITHWKIFHQKLCVPS